jgi:hypothetical protein
MICCVQPMVLRLVLPLPLVDLTSKQSCSSPSCCTRFGAPPAHTATVVFTPPIIGTVSVWTHILSVALRPRHATGQASSPRLRRVRAHRGHFNLSRADIRHGHGPHQCRSRHRPRLAVLRRHVPLRGDGPRIARNWFASQPPPSSAAVSACGRSYTVRSFGWTQSLTCIVRSLAPTGQRMYITDTNTIEQRRGTRFWVSQQEH